MGLIGSHGIVLYLALTVLAAFPALHHHETQAPFSAEQSAPTGDAPSHSDDASAHSSCLLCAWHSHAQDTVYEGPAVFSPLRQDEVPVSRRASAHPRPALDGSCPPRGPPAFLFA